MRGRHPEAEATIDRPMSRRPLLLAAALAALVCAAPATASPVLVYDNGKVTKSDDPWLPAASATNAVPAEAQRCNPSADRSVSAPIGASSAHSARRSSR